MISAPTEKARNHSTSKTIYMMQGSQILMKRQIRKCKRTKATTLLPCLPNEIMFFHILPKVPARCLHKLNCVSKLWYNTIHDPKFIATYLSHGKSNPSLVAILRLDSFLRYLHLEEAQGAAVRGHHHASSVGLRLESYSPIVGHCNGLTCNRCPPSIQISNPSTREVLTFPQPSISPLTKRLCNNIALHGFGCDPVLTTEYKVIQICFNYCGYYDIWAYTLGTNSWRNITATCNYPPSYYPSILPPVCISGTLYWMNSKYGKILSFDLHLEKFLLVPCPEVFPAPGLIYHGLFDLEGCPSLLFGRNDNLIKDGFQLIIYRLRVVHTEQQQASSSRRNWMRVRKCIRLPFKPDTIAIQIVVASKQLYLQCNTKDGDFILYNVTKMIIQNKLAGLGLSEEVVLVNHVENLLSLKTFVPVPSAGDFKVKYVSSRKAKHESPTTATSCFSDQQREKKRKRDVTPYWFPVMF